METDSKIATGCIVTIIFIIGIISTIIRPSWEQALFWSFWLFFMMWLAEEKKIMPTRIVIGVISYSRLSYLQDLLYSIRNVIKDNNQYNFEIIVSDDLSTDKTVSWIKEEAIPKCLVNHLIEAKTRGGVARNSNRIIQKFNELGADRLYLLNDDILISSSQVFEIYEDTIEKTGYEHFCYTDNRSIYPYNTVYRNNIALAHRAQGDGVFMIFTKHALEVLGGFDIRYGLLGSEHCQMSLRASLTGLSDGVLDVVEAQDKILVRQYQEIVPYSISNRYTHIAVGNKQFIQDHIDGFKIHIPLET